MTAVAVPGEFSLGANPIRSSVPGSPFQSGESVVVTSVCDEVGRGLGYQKYVGSRGVVEYLEYASGSGQHYPDDPMIGVRLVGVGEVIEFWKDELKRDGSPPDCDGKEGV